MYHPARAELLSSSRTAGAHAAPWCRMSGRSAYLLGNTNRPRRSAAVIANFAARAGVTPAFLIGTGYFLCTVGAYFMRYA